MAEQYVFQIITTELYYTYMCVRVWVRDSNEKPYQVWEIKIFPLYWFTNSKEDKTVFTKG